MIIPSTRIAGPTLILVALGVLAGSIIALILLGALAS